jgi:hypothetical protein
MSAAGSGLGGCSWRRCSHAATAVVAFGLPHPLAGTQRAYCEFHAARVAAQPGATLTVAAGGVAVQPTLPGLDGAAQDASASGQQPPWGGGR